MPSLCPLQQRAGPEPPSVSADWPARPAAGCAPIGSFSIPGLSDWPISAELGGLAAFDWSSPGRWAGPCCPPLLQAREGRAQLQLWGACNGEGLGGDLTSGSSPSDAYPRPQGLPWLPRLFLRWGSGLRSEGAPPLGRVWEDHFAGGQNARGVHGAGWGRLLPARPQPSAFSSQEEDLWTLPAEIRTRLSPSIPGRIAKNNNKCLREREGRGGQGKDELAVWALPFCKASSRSKLSG